MMRLFELGLLGVTAVRASMVLEGRYSAFSGIVTALSVEGQEVPVQLDFTVPSSRLIAKGICPPFIESCFDIDKCNDCEYVDCRLTHDETGLNSGYVIAFSKFRFLYTTRVSCYTPTGFESAGSVGASRRSELFRNKIMVIEDAHYGSGSFRMTEIGRMQGIPESRIVKIAQLYEAWVFEAAIVSSQDKFLTQISAVNYDPAVPDLVVPENLKNLIVSNFPVAIEEREDGIYKLSGLVFCRETAPVPA
jgi:hypothetical protein